MEKEGSEIQQLFNKGEYRLLLQKTVDADSWPKKEADLSYIIGALCFTGRMEEAQIIAAPVFQKKNLAAKIRARFFLGLGYTRLSEYKKAIAFFADNLKLVRTTKLLPEHLFFIYQGVSFYKFFCGKFSAAKKASDIAFEAAFAADDLYGKALSSDIRSHILLGLGQTSAGFEMRTRAAQFGKRLGNRSLLVAFRISTLTDRAQLGFAPAESLLELTEAMKTLNPEDNYSRANLLLELARQWTLRGQLSKAGQVLDEASALIYANQNRRQEAVLNLRYGYLFYCSGDSSRGLSSIRSAKRTLHPIVDRKLDQEASGLELKLVRSLGMSEPAERIQRQLESKSLRDCNFIHQRILARDSQASKLDGLIELPRKGEDPLGDLMDNIRRDRGQSVDEILRTGYLGLLYDVLQLQRQKQILYVDLRPGLVLCFDKGEVLAMEGLTSLLRKVLHSLSENVMTKEQIFLKAWGFKYDSLRHDTVIYAAINSLRKLLGQRSQWLETVENGYRLNPSLSVVFHKAVQEISIKAPEQFPKLASERVSADVGNSLNFRQLEILQRLAKEKYIDVQQCKKLFRVSDITASRDLSALTGAGHVIRIGRGRATKYGLRAHHEI